MEALELLASFATATLIGLERTQALRQQAERDLLTGVATAPLDARTVQGLYAAAAAALYRAKALGRNQVVAAARADARAA